MQSPGAGPRQARPSDGKLDLEVTIPPNVRAYVHVPSTAGTAVIDLASGAAFEAAVGTTATVLSRGSGVHTFSSTVLR